MKRSLVLCLGLAVLTGCGGSENRVDRSQEAAPSGPSVDPATAELLREVGELYGSQRYREGLARLEEELRRDPERPLLHHSLGVFRAALNDFEGAVTAFEEELARNPNHLDSHRALATALILVDRPEDSLPHFEICRAGEPDDDVCASGLGGNLAALGRPEEALPHLEHAASLRHDADTWAQLGLLRRQLGDLERAAEAFARALDDDPSHLPTLLGYGQILTTLGRAEDGEILLERHRRLSAVQDRLDAFERSRRAATGEPAPEAFFEVARLQLERGDRSAAVAAYERAVELDSHNPIAALELADLYLDDGRFKDAELCLELALAADPRSSAPLFLRGLLRLKTGDVAAANEAFESSRALGDWPLAAHVDAGFAYLDAGEPASAAREFETALSFDQRNPDAHYGLARVRYLRGERRAAEEAARRAAELAPANSGAWALLASLRLEAGDGRGADEAFRRVVALERLALLSAGGVERLFEDFPGSEETHAFFRRTLARGEGTESSESLR